GGKFALPFTRTDLVWDGDVYPEGVSASFKQPLGRTTSFQASSLYFVIDESVGGKDSRMIGGQMGAVIKPTASLELALSAAYYDYRLSSILGGDAGDFRSNLFANGRYLSDFNLVDVIGSASWLGLGKDWPVRLTVDYVKNRGAAVSADTAFSIDTSLGKTGSKGDWRFGYGYAEAGVDAVFAAFSNDNTALATNYQQHSLFIDYTLAPRLILNGTFYRYRPKEAIYVGALDPDDWINRLRINLLAEF
ncbi:MAG: putative porin, partial [Sphingorhabdus sp.]